MFIPYGSGKSRASPLREERRIATLNALRESAIFTVIGSNSYVVSLRDPFDLDHIELMEQVMVAKEERKPIFIIWDRPTTPENRRWLIECFKGLRYGETEVDFSSPYGAQQGADAVMKFMEGLK